MTKTDNELVKEGSGSLVPLFKFGAFELYPPCALSEDERRGWNSTSNNKVRILEKIKAKKKVKQIKKNLNHYKNYGYINMDIQNM